MLVKGPPVASFTKEVNPWLAKRPLVFNGRLANRGLISLVKEATGMYLTEAPWYLNQDDIIKWKHFPRYCPFVRGIHRSPVNSPHKGQWCGALIFSLICTWINGWVNNREAGDLRRHRAHYDVSVMTRYHMGVLWGWSVMKGNIPLTWLPWDVYVLPEASYSSELMLLVLGVSNKNGLGHQLCHNGVTEKHGSKLQHSVKFLERHKLLGDRCAQIGG